MYDIITAGSAAVDIFVDTGAKLFQKADSQGHIRVPFGSKILIERMITDTGGGGTNTAAAFSRLGFRTGYIGKLGVDENSRRIIKGLEKERISTELVSREKGMTAGLSIILDAKGHDRTILTYKASNDDLKPKDINAGKLKTRWLYLCTLMKGSYKTLEWLAAYGKKKGIKVAFNPSTYLAKKGANYLGKVLRNTDVLIFNREEAELLAGAERDIRKLIKKVRKTGAGIVVITDAQKRAYAYDGSMIYSIKPHRVHVVEATGAGDAFGSGFVAGLMRGKSIEFCLQLGLAEAESVIQHYGAKNKLLRWNEAIGIIRRKPGRINTDRAF